MERLSTGSLVLNRTNEEIRISIRFSDCGDINKVYGIAQSIALIPNLSMKLVH